MSTDVRRGALFLFALPAVMQGFLHAPAQSLLQGIYGKHVGVPLAALGIAVLAGRLFDVAIYPLIGILSDSWRRRRGSYRGLIAIGTLITAVGLWKLFRPGDDADAFYFATWFIVASFGWSVTEIPYKSWSVQLSSDYVIRTRIQTWLAVAGIFGTIVFYLVPLVGQSSGLLETTEFDLPALALAAVVVVVLMPLFNLVGLARAPSGDHRHEAQGATARELWTAVRQNGPFVYFTLMFFLSGLTAGISQGVNYLYVDSYLGLGPQLAAILIMAGPAMLIGVPIWGVLCQRWERQKVWAVSLALLAACQAGYAFVPPGKDGLVFATLLTLGVFLLIPCIFVAGPAMIGDLVDYGRWKFRRDHSGLYIAVFSMVAMAVNAMGAGMGLILLDALGYDATAATQAPAGIAAMKLVAAWIPAVGTALAVPLVWRFPLPRARHAALVAEINARGDAPAAAAPGSRYAIHPDYAKVPSFDFSFAPWLLGLLNALGRRDRRRKCARPRAGVRRHVRTIAGGDGQPLELVVMAPEHASIPAPLLLYCHGGAFVFTYGTAHLQLCERYALDAGCVVVLVDYRLAPQHRFPKGFDDCYATLKWLMDEGASIGGDRRRIAVMGDSAGGALAAGIAQKAVDDGCTLAGQLLAYPVLDSECKTRSATEFVDVPLFNARNNRRMWPAYLGDVATPRYAAPGLRADLRGLAPAWIDVAEFDPLRDEGIAYAEALRAAGVPVTLHRTTGTIHGYELSPGNPEAVRAIAGRIAFLKAVFAQGEAR